MKVSILFILTNLICFLSYAQPANDDPCAGTLLTVGATCTYTASTTVAATNTTGVPAPGCASYSGPDVWFRFVVPASGAVQLDSSPGTTTDSGMALYSGPCGSLTLVSCDDDSSPNGAMSLINASGLTPGATVFVRMWDYGGGNGTFSICVRTALPCGMAGPTAGTNDYCPTAATLTQGAGTFSATTDVTFSSDQPGNLSSVFCGSIENNSWYQFVATSTTHTFPITSVTGCVSNFGIQAQVYSITYTGGCCSGFTSVSNCYNPGNTTLGTVTASSLTVGNSYMLMIDGNAGDGCEFTISGWTGTGILPVQLIEFTGSSSQLGNEINWITESEFQNNYFDIMHSRDAIHFEKIATIQGSGSTKDQHQYQFFHQGVPEGKNFYQLKQVDLNGGETYSKMITVNSIATDGLFSFYPNPTNNELTLQFQSSKETIATLNLYNQQGVIVKHEVFKLNEGMSVFTRDLKELKAGVYSLEVSTEQNKQQERIIKID